MARTPKPPPITVDYREKPCGFMLGGVMPCKLSPKHRGPHDPAPIPPVFDYDPADWAIHAKGRTGTKSSKDVNVILIRPASGGVWRREHG